MEYMSPEILSGETQLLDGRCDVHALGVVLFELLAGKTPFPASNRNEIREQILFRQPTKLSEVDSSLPSELETICSKAMAKRLALSSVEFLECVTPSFHLAKRFTASVSHSESSTADSWTHITVLVGVRKLTLILLGSV